MKKRFLVVIALMAVVITLHNPIVAYFHLWSFDYRRSQDVTFKYNSLLNKAINSAQLAGWKNIPRSLSESYAPKETNIIKARFTRGAIFPTRQILLEYIVVERQDNTLIGGRVEYLDYLDIVYLYQISDSEYKYIGKFRKFLP
ncbi:MAG: hypothetical protein HC860_24210 [Alkalinema sp. RU_4_3]|nr:hypothetical protein [Alkalinema sp. RU_4_3]